MKLLSLVSKLIHGGPLNGHKLDLGALLAFVALLFPDLPQADIVTVVSQGVIVWGALSRVIKFVASKVKGAKNV